MQARDIMTPDVITVAPDTALPELVRLMLERRISAVPVVEDGTLVGLVSEGDLLRRPELGTAATRPRWLLMLGGADRDAAAYARTHGRSAGEVMSQPVISVTEDTPVEEVAALMDRHRVKRLPVLREGHLVGILTRADLLRALALRLAPPAGADDRRIRETLLAELRTQPWGPSPTDVSVVVRDGVVHLWGSVRSEDQRHAVVAAAESTPGVRTVEDNMATRHPADPMDRPNWFTTPPP
ncbi:MAG: CBS domain-containing protein [Rhodospirillales bacterium]|jgi:CBS domain-containing protein|nr:CBS domain-containing protein [Rhodospirillales bacterium]